MGKRTAKLLATLFRNTDDILHFHFTIEELEAVKDIGAGTAGTIIEYFKTHRHLLERLLARVTLIFPEVTEVGGILNGQTFCVTGTFVKSRDEIHSLIEANGGEVRTAVSGNLDYLIAGDSAGSKQEKAKTLGVKIISFDELQEMLRE